MYFANNMCPEPVRIRAFEGTLNKPVAQFIESWSIDDVYDRFGTAGINGPERIASEIRQHLRPAFVAICAREVVGLLDYAQVFGEIHIGVVVSARFRRRAVATNLVQAILRTKACGRPVIAECRSTNRPAIALLRACRFYVTRSAGAEMLWRVA